MLKILIGEGLENIPFGINQTQLKAIIGEPDDIEKTASLDDNEPISEVWHYDNLEISALFDFYDNEWELVSLGTTSPDATLNGKKLIGLSRKKVTEEVKSLNLGKYEVEDLSADENMSDVIMSFESTGLDFWFDDKMLIEIQWSPIIED